MKYKSDIEKMQVALEEAKKALEIDEVPIGAAGAPPELVRLSIGIEDIEDIIEDLSQALESTR